MAKDNKSRVSVTIPAELAERVRVEAELQHRSFSGQASYFLALAVGQSSTKAEVVR
jgi:hypothetical protein